jgi:rare lipoprotein A
MYKIIKQSIFLGGLLLLVSSCELIKSSTNTADPNIASLKPGDLFAKGQASYYGGKFHGRKTASGEVFDKRKITAAHKTLPFKTYVEVTNLKNGKKVIVKINDRMPKTSKRIIDLSEEAAKQLGMIRDGVVNVELRIAKP